MYTAYERVVSEEPFPIAQDLAVDWNLYSTTGRPHQIMAYAMMEDYPERSRIPVVHCLANGIMSDTRHYLPGDYQFVLKYYLPHALQAFDDHPELEELSGRTDIGNKTYNYVLRRPA